LRHYELLVVASPALSQEESAGAWDRVKELIVRGGAQITEETQMGMRRLAYPIRKGGQTFLEGSYQLTRFSTPGTVPMELETHLKLAENVLRFLLVKTAPPRVVPPPPPVQAAVATAEVVAEAPAAGGLEGPAEATPEVPVAQEEAPQDGGAVAVADDALPGGHAAVQEAELEPAKAASDPSGD
jgi:small subunit ribosomal protein S6